jgi:putative DNA primase/helicase
MAVEGAKAAAGGLRIIEGGRVLGEAGGDFAPDDGPSGPGGGGGGPPMPPPPGGPEDEDGARPIFASDDGLAAELTKALGDEWRHVASSGAWHQWNGQVWQRDTTKLVMHLSRHVCRASAQGIGDLGLATRISSDHSIYAAVKIAGTDRRHATEASAFDADPWLLNTPGGIVDLKTGQLGPHDPAALMTRLNGAGPEGECPRWEQFLRDATGKDQGTIDYLQRVAGYCLTGSVEEHAIFFLYGPGGTGKTVWQTILSALLGDYAVSAPMDVFTVATGERHPTELAHLAGARLVTAAETEEGRRWDEAKLKAISGGDTITARFSRGDFFDFAPMFKLMIAGNHRPRMRSADDAMRRRFHVIPFTRKPEKPDKELIAKLRDELGGILKWAVAGEIARRRLGGLKPPKAVAEATDEYFEAENTIGRWVDERCLCALPSLADGELSELDGPEIARRKAAFAASQDLYRDFKSWSDRVGEYCPSLKVFSEKLRLHGEAAGLWSYVRRPGGAFADCACGLPPASCRSTNLAGAPPHHAPPHPARPGWCGPVMCRVRRSKTMAMNTPDERCGGWGFGRRPGRV